MKIFGLALSLGLLSAAAHAETVNFQANDGDRFDLRPDRFCLLLENHHLRFSCLDVHGLWDVTANVFALSGTLVENAGSANPGQLWSLDYRTDVTQTDTGFADATESGVGSVWRGDQEIILGAATNPDGYSAVYDITVEGTNFGAWPDKSPCDLRLCGRDFHLDLSETSPVPLPAGLLLLLSGLLAMGMRKVFRL